jgi:hypothetical protein
MKFGGNGEPDYDALAKGPSRESNQHGLKAQICSHTKESQGASRMNGKTAVDNFSALTKRLASQHFCPAKKCSRAAGIPGVRCN